MAHQQIREASSLVQCFETIRAKKSTRFWVLRGNALLILSSIQCIVTTATHWILIEDNPTTRANAIAE